MPETRRASLSLRMARPVTRAGPAEPCDVLISRQGEILDLVAAGTGEADQELDCNGLWVLPAAVDPHVHFRDPGQTHKEDLHTGLLAAAAGGYCAVAMMPNTDPPMDTPERIRTLLCRARELASSENLPRAFAVACASKAREGKQPADYKALKEAGACGFSDDGSWIESRDVLVEALRASRELGVPVMEHCEDSKMAANGAVNLGWVSKQLGVPGRPEQAEISALKRDLEALEEEGGKLHVQHLSTGKGVEIVRRAKSMGLNITAEVTPHHLVFTEDDVLGGGTDFKMNPPLRTEQDRLALIRGLADGTIDMVATDHAPHSPEEKANGILDSPAGVVGLETAVPVVFSLLRELGYGRVLDAMVSKPASLIGLPGERRIASGSPADLMVLDPKARWTVDTERLASKSANTPFKGRVLEARVVYTIVAGKVAYRAD